MKSASGRCVDVEDAGGGIGMIGGGTGVCGEGCSRIPGVLGTGILDPTPQVAAADTETGALDPVESRILTLLGGALFPDRAEVLLRLVVPLG